MLYYKTKEFTRLSQTGFWREGKNVFFFRNGRFMSSNKIKFGVYVFQQDNICGRDVDAHGEQECRRSFF